MREPYLIQRLKKPFKLNEPSDMMKAFSEAFSFGGGKVRGGISKEAWEVLSRIWRYDYMGSAEFEFGAVPQSLDRVIGLREENKLVKFEFNVIAKRFNYKTDKQETADAVVYIVCEEQHKAKVEIYIKALANTNEAFITKEYVGLGESICGQEYHKDTVGWHDIDNDYLFFTDKEMYDNFCKILKLE